jgi:hypothetical protein
MIFPVILLHQRRIQKISEGMPRTSITTEVNDRIRRRKRSFPVVYNVNYDRISSCRIRRNTIVYDRNLHCIRPSGGATGGGGIPPAFENFD